MYCYLKYTKMLTLWYHRLNGAKFSRCSSWIFEREHSNYYFNIFFSLLPGTFYDSNNTKISIFCSIVITYWQFKEINITILHIKMKTWRDLEIVFIAEIGIQMNVVKWRELSCSRKQSLWKHYSSQWTFPIPLSHTASNLLCFS